MNAVMPIPSKYVGELVEDANGVFHPTERARIAEQEYFRELSKLRIPQEHLSTELDPKHTMYPPKLHFGIAITGAAVTDFTLRNKLLPSDDLAAADDQKDPIDVWFCMSPFMRYLRKTTGCYLALRPVFDPADQLWAIELYDNYSIDKLKYPASRERKLVEQVQEITGIRDPPKWYWGPMLC
ncbi:hypothetical protein FA95DRAFT_1595780 [Auriscalpium vulgare]|uniref:Uncharacterized protein n=1 Tax=Auriscalpium vulgare TaxID=40419 RepID=A0ACB8RTL2_9AGAM|nr:hypothetical protein FA95DRAFT_1595780 [Auriscalpium vulgare]